MSTVKLLVQPRYSQSGKQMAKKYSYMRLENMVTQYSHAQKDTWATKIKIILQKHVKLQGILFLIDMVRMNEQGWTDPIKKPKTFTNFEQKYLTEFSKSETYYFKKIEWETDLSSRHKWNYWKASSRVVTRHPFNSCTNDKFLQDRASSCSACTVKWISPVDKRNKKGITSSNTTVDWFLKVGDI